MAMAINCDRTCTSYDVCDEEGMLNMFIPNTTCTNKNVEEDDEED